MEGIQAAQARIAGIQQRFQPKATDPLGSNGAASNSSALTLGSNVLGSNALGSTFGSTLTSGLGSGYGSVSTLRNSASGTAFSQIMGQALQATPATKRSPGAYGSLQPPADLKSYGNGKIPSSALDEIGVGSHRLESRAAGAFKLMSSDAARAGITIGVTDSYRSYEAQVDVAERKGLYSQGGLAAKPGTSNHGWGLALDLDLNDSAQQWIRENGAKYGFVEDTPREPWHWTYRPDNWTA